MKRLLLTLLLLAPLQLRAQQPPQQEPDLDSPTTYTASGQPSFASLRSPLNARVADRRFYTREALYLANEMSESGDPFFRQAQNIGLPIEHDTDFQYLTATEAYWYSRYMMQTLITESRLGVVLIHGPYITEKAIEIANSQYNRDRGENEPANKDVLFQHLIPSYLARTGFPRRYEDASPLMIEYAWGDPHFLRKVDKGTTFELAENRWRERKFQELYGAAYQPLPGGAGVGGNDMWRYRVNYREDFSTLRWSNDRMAHYVDLGGAGQSLMKAVLWMEYFFRQTHHDEFLGNNPEEGFRGSILTLASVSKMLLLKSSFFYDGKKLGGINPFQYDPNKHLSYFPHEVAVRGRYVGDLPPRPENFVVRDPRSLLFDQASLLWGLTEYYYFADPDRDRSDPVYRDAYANWDRVFGDKTPYDGSVMERKYTQLARGLSNVVVRNLEAMHRDPQTGVLVSEWDPRTQRGHTVVTQDLGMAILALANYHHHLAKAEPELANRAAALLRTQADFLTNKLQNADGSFADGYDLEAGRAVGGAPTLVSEAFAIRGLLRVYQELGDENYVAAAKRGFRTMNETLWDPQRGVYRSQVGASVTVYTPLNVGAALGALREMILVTRDETELGRYKRFWVQAVDSSGIQQSEYEETGDSVLVEADSDHDGIPRMEFGDGRYGIASVAAGRVEIDTPLPTGATVAEKPSSSDGGVSK